MDQSSIPNNTVPVQTTSPEEDATLLAIEALEARTVDPNPRPLNAPREIPVPPRVAPTPPVTPKVIEPIIAKLAASAPKPIAVPKPALVPIKTTATVIISEPKIVDVVPVPVTPPKPKKSSTPAEEMAEELAAAPASRGFQFFINQKPPRRLFIIVGIIVVLVGAGVAVYFATR
jgi:hypothetical protein